MKHQQQESDNDRTNNPAALYGEDGYKTGSEEEGGFDHEAETSYKHIGAEKRSKRRAAELDTIIARINSEVDLLDRDYGDVER